MVAVMDQNKKLKTNCTAQVSRVIPSPSRYLGLYNLMQSVPLIIHYDLIAGFAAAGNLFAFHSRNDHSALGPAGHELCFNFNFNSDSIVSRSPNTTNKSTYLHSIRLLPGGAASRSAFALGMHHGGAYQQVDQRQQISYKISKLLPYISSIYLGLIPSSMAFQKSTPVESENTLQY